MNIYGKIPKGASRSEMSLTDLLQAGVPAAALGKRSQQVNDADCARNLCMAKANEASSFKGLRQACERLIKATVQAEYMKELGRIEPVAGPLYRPEEIKARLAAWRHARSQREKIDASIRQAFSGNRTK